VVSATLPITATPPTSGAQPATGVQPPSWTRPIIGAQPIFTEHRGRGIDEILARARATLRRVSAVDAAAEQAAGAILVDIRPIAQRAAHGQIPGALIVERNVLEWRFDPRSDARLDCAGSYDLRIVVYCQEGYTSSLAAAALQELGLHGATDLDGGFEAWRAAGLPTTTPVV
jgi:rhodanese-related sulfurtransferase